MKEIKLANNKGIALVDDEDFELVSQYSWYLNRDKACAYCGNSRKEKNKQTQMHRLILGATVNEMIDHINHNGLDNRRSNLRIATNSQNQMNARKRNNTTSKYKGVSFCKRTKQWQVSIKLDKRQFLGRYDNEEQAAKVYDDAARKHHGEFAHLNFN